MGGCSSANNGTKPIKKGGKPCSEVAIESEGIFISTQQLAILMDCCDAAQKLRILDATIKPEGGDVIYKDFAEK